MDQNIFKKFSDSARKILTQAQRLAKDMHSALCSEHILISLTLLPGTLSYEILHDPDNLVNAEQVRLILSLRGPESNLASGISAPAKKILEQAAKAAAEFHHSQIDAEHILLGITLTSDSLAYQIISRLGINPKNIRNQILGIFDGLKTIEKINRQLTIKQSLQEMMRLPTESFFSSSPSIPNKSPFNQSAETEHKTKLAALNYFAQNLTQAAKQKKLDPVIGREQEIKRIIQTLARKTKNNPILIGDPGVGKTAIVEGLAQAIVQGHIPACLANKQIFSLDLALLVAGTTFRGQFEQRLKKIIQEASHHPEVILFIDEFHTMVGTGSAEGSMDAANILKPALTKGNIRLIGATTIDEYRKQIEKDSALERRLQTILIKEPTINQTIEILEGLKPAYEKHHHVKISSEAIIAAASLSSRYIFDRFLPDKAIDLIDEASAAVQLASRRPSLNQNFIKKQHTLEKILEKKNKAIENQDFEQAARLREQEIKLLNEIKNYQHHPPRRKRQKVTADEIAKVVSNWTGIPVGSLVKSEKIKLKNLEKELQKFVIGQDEAVHVIAQTIRKSKTGINPPDRPLGSFLFLGPTGVGKTFLAKTLASKIYGTPKALIKIDMSEFMERHNIASLVGAPPGYVGYEESGKLTELVRRQPYSVILLDEIEKAHPEVFNLLLQILEDGYLTDAKGRRINFRNTLIILTSNIGIEKLNQQAVIGFNKKNLDKTTDWQNLKEDILGELNQHFRPEFLNRLDKILIFNPLTRQQIKKIAQRETKKLQIRLLKENIHLVISPKVWNFLAKSGFNPEYGARPLRRAIAEYLEDPLSNKILNGEIKPGCQVKITLANKKLSFQTSLLKKKLAASNKPS